MKKNDRAVISEHVLVQQLGDETVILDLNSETYFGLDAVGTRTWQLLGEGKTLAEICVVLMGEYDVSRETVERDMAALTDKLLSHKLMAVA